MPSYKVKEIYYTLQGEGAQTGRPAVFLRFSGCNLWSGREQDRATAICQFCDTDFWGMDGVSGGSYTAEELAAKVSEIWASKDEGVPYVVCTGGEPLLQLDSPLVDELQKRGFEVAVETNGTIEITSKLDWICMSPKANTEIIQQSGNEIKIIFPQSGIDPVDFESLDFEHFFLQPMDNADKEENTRKTVQYCLEHPKWKLSLQTHKLLLIP